VSGTVVSDDPRVPLGRVQIRVWTLPEASVTESDLFGRFSLDLPAGTWVLHASATGFADLEEELKLPRGQSMHPALRLQPVEYEAEELVIHGNRPSKAVMQLLNAPLTRELTPFEKKIAPAVQAMTTCYMVTIWALIGLGAAGVIALPK
jgi:hypothetical protein